MKNDSTFKFVAAIVLAGVIVALFAPTPRNDSFVSVSARPAATGSASE